TRTSVLERMCGPLCDATLGATGSAAMLESLERSNLLLVALDRRAEWYRYHHLLQDLLVAELQRREPEIVPRLHLGAAAWYEANGLGELAIDHAQAAGDTDRGARLGERPGGRGPALDGVVRGPAPDRAVPGRHRPRGADLRAAGAAGQGRTLGGGGRAGTDGRPAPRRQHHGELPGLPARPAVPRRGGRGARGRDAG